MKLTLKGCEHRALESWGRVGFNVTCLSCYERFVFVDVPTRAGMASVDVRPADPPAPCSHTNRKPVAAQITKQMPYRDAICTDCGVIQRHPDGRGAWTDVQFYGYVIHEEAY